MKLSELFRLAAKNHLLPNNQVYASYQNSHQKSSYICCALGLAHESKGESYFSKLSKEGRNIVQKAIKEVTIEDYLVKHKHLTRAQTESKLYSRKIQAYRKAWMLHLATELEKKNK